MLENFRKRLSKRVGEFINLHQEEHPEELVYDFWETKLGYYLYASGSFIKVNPDNIFFFLAYNLYLFVTPLTMYCLIACTLLFNPVDFANVISLVHLSLILFVGLIIQIHMIFHREHGIIFVETVFKLESNRTYRKNEKSSTRESIRLYITQYWPPVIWFSWFLYICSQPVYQYFINSRAFVLTVELWFPFDTHNILGFLAAFLYEVLMVNCFSSQVITTIPAFLYLCNLIIDEYSILIDSLRTLHEDTVTEFRNTEQGRDYKSSISSFDLYRDAMFLQCLRRRYKQIIHHHQTIISLYERLQVLSSVPLTVTLGAGGTIVAFGISAIISGFGDYLFKVIFTIVVTINLFNGAIICYLGQRLTDLGENVREELYFTNWYDWPEDMKRSLRIMLARTLRPPSLTSAYFTIKPNLNTYATSIKAAYSFINVVLAFQH